MDVDDFIGKDIDCLFVEKGGPKATHKPSVARQLSIINLQLSLNFSIWRRGRWLSLVNLATGLGVIVWLRSKGLSIFAITKDREKFVSSKIFLK